MISDRQTFKNVISKNKQTHPYTQIILGLRVGHYYHNYYDLIKNKIQRVAMKGALPFIVVTSLSRYKYQTLT